ncbi:chemotaxis protein CheW [Vagococcus fluvialis]|jgi:chemotaxis signal transduction protein|uniref:chemotaxis protein CheW n=1 Tax=Vagococcus fluvialis TaxID=2738 RepID=UPI001A8F53EB|nr:chemotaxis protein CheW [Vagococcus fluvialis]MBO0443380.1 chemotaxis protein CheW [Vagococcus fluvialis]MCM2137811.1 chemotaxis protein CheW [Vagococcus fluvialis]WNF89158.1 chemotaxis protein CheW [Vagococcus fluvialis]
MEKQIVFLSKKQELSIPIEKINKIIQWQETIPVPETSTFVLGVIEHNEHVLPVIDLNDRLYGIPTEVSNEMKIIIVQWKEEYLGLLVESIRGIMDFEKNQFELMENEVTFDKNYIESFIKAENGIIIQLNVDTLFEGNIMLDKLLRALEIADTAEDPHEELAEE